MVHGRSGMARRAKPPRWQEGSKSFELRLPASRTKSGKEETVTMSFQWRALKGRPMTDQDWIRHDRGQARQYFNRVRRNVETGKAFTNHDAQDLCRALTRAMWAWCRTRGLKVGPSNADTYDSFAAVAPEDIRLLHSKASYVCIGLEDIRIEASDAVSAVEAALDKLIPEEASQ